MALRRTVHPLADFGLSGVIREAGQRSRRSREARCVIREGCSAPAERSGLTEIVNRQQLNDLEAPGTGGELEDREVAESAPDEGATDW